ncbi:MAG: Fic family protein [Bacteroidales bacterium]|nr:Fic family protein [Bacteroidales bacterium]
MRRIICIFAENYIMRKIYIYQKEGWPNFYWDKEIIAPLLLNVRYIQGQLIGKMSVFGFDLKNETHLSTITNNVLKSSEIEGEYLNTDQVRSSVAKRLGMDVSGLIPSERKIEGIVEMTFDATHNANKPLTKKRLFSWHKLLFEEKERDSKLSIGAWRKEEGGEMQVVSGAMGKERIHFQAPDWSKIDFEIDLFLDWINNKTDIDNILKASIAHLWIVTIHPFDDGNGRIARAIADMLLARADNISQRFYSMSSQIRIERKDYYDILEKTQKGNLDITKWIEWFLNCLERAFIQTNANINKLMNKSKFWENNKTIVFNERQTKIINLLFNGFEGKLTSSKWSKINHCSQDTALRDINDLIEKKVLKKDVQGGRSTSYDLCF